MMKNYSVVEQEREEQYGAGLFVWWGFFFCQKLCQCQASISISGEEIGKEGKEGPTQDLKTPFYELLIKAPRFNLWR